MSSNLKLKNEGQPVDYNLYSEFSPISMEVIDGRFFFTDIERENLLILLIYNVGIQRTIEIIEEHKCE